MRTARFVTPFIAAVAAISLAACGDSPTATTAALFNDSTATLDIAASAGDAAATTVQVMIDNEAFAGASADMVTSSAALLDAADPTSSVTINRTKTCLDGAGVVVPNCTPIASVRKIIIHATIDGTRATTKTTTGGTSATWTGSVHRVADDTTTRIFVGTTETSRVHNAQATAHDTTLFTEATTTRLNAEVAHDSVKSVTFNLPRSTNPWPVSGMIVRVDSVHTAITKANKSETKDVVRTVEVDFPADAQGNVVLKVNAKVCNLNLVTHSVSGCH